MQDELAKAYDPKAIEPETYAQWVAAGAFDADPDASGAPYCIVIPPPNVTAPLHLGHALNNSLQDVLVRFRRMQQRNTLWMPGTDHAGIATQTVVEKRLTETEGKRRTDYDRDDFIAHVQAWKDQYEARIIEQLKLMGCSCDWRKTRFTMDDVCAKAVRETFFRLFADGLIYRGKRLVNWDPATQTVLADDEVEHETVQGYFWYMRYPLAEPVTVGGETLDHVTVATTRPETMLGDTAVAMNPRDPRAKALVGKMVTLPLVGREIPIIADEHVVLPDPESEDEKAKFSTGFLKVTPAHDFDDEAIGERHLDEIHDALVAGNGFGPGLGPASRHTIVFINILAPDGTISDKHGWFDCRSPEAKSLIGKDRFDARNVVVDLFRKKGLLEDVRDYAHEVGHSYRSHEPIEPYRTDQWYVAVKKPIADCQLPIADLKDELVSQREGVSYLRDTDVPVNSLAGLALAPLLTGRLKFTPDRYGKTYQAWLENLRDWPISRQLWWGHRIPVWHAHLCLSRVSSSYSCKQLEADALHSLSVLFEKAGMAEQVLVAVEHVDDGVPLLRVCTRAKEADGLLAALETFLKGAGRKTFHPDEVSSYKGKLAGFQELQKEAGQLGPFVYSLHRDEDVLDTWFSSALWPFSTLGWPDETPDFATYYPGDVLCTAREIITLWVSRMVMMGQYCARDIPFSDVFIHAMIQDGDGQKMSKTLGNGVDPTDIIHSHGADAMRFTLCQMTTQTQDVRMPVDMICPFTGEEFTPKLITLPTGDRVAAPTQESPAAKGRKMISSYGLAKGLKPSDEMPLARNTSPKFDIGRNFCNKLWNASRFAMMNVEALPAWSEIHPAEHLADRWILSGLAAAVRDATQALEAFRFNELADGLYHFLWDDFCDWYLEIAKARIQAGEHAPKAVLACVLDTLLRLLHPIMPFITEAIWQQLNTVAPHRGAGDEPAEPMLVCAQWPRADAAKLNERAQHDMAFLQEIVRQIRNARTDHNVPPRQKINVAIEAAGAARELIADNLDMVRALAGIETADFRDPAEAAPANAAALAAGDVRLFVLDVVDTAAELARLTKQAATLTKGIAGIEGKLKNEKFVTSAPPEVVQRERDRLTKLATELTAVQQALESLE